MNISAEIETVRRLADRGKFETARKQCELLLLKNPADRELLCLLGVIYNATGLIEEAESSFLKVLYLEPDNLEALAHISLLYEKRGDTMKARIYTDRLRRSGNRNNNG
jgi:Flp pilus assembly protein TadD, contains TPR repeats